MGRQNKGSRQRRDRMADIGEIYTYICACKRRTVVRSSCKAVAKQQEFFLTHPLQKEPKIFFSSPKYNRDWHPKAFLSTRVKQ